MSVLAIDPGTDQSALVYFADFGDRRGIVQSWKLENSKVLEALKDPTRIGFAHYDHIEHLAVERIASYGKPVGQEVFDTCVWIGRFIGCWGGDYTLVFRKDVKMHLCHACAKVNDAMIRQALIDRFGPGKEKAIGKKKTPGLLYGIKGDEWQALALAVTFSDKRQLERSA